MGNILKLVSFVDYLLTEFAGQILNLRSNPCFDPGRGVKKISCHNVQELLVILSASFLFLPLAQFYPDINGQIPKN